ncbi:hydrogen peroxide-inducible genes activator [Pseudonocardia hispaniensis]|uniref:Probable hydrogen peroxide-inducible genes activator n=1 Tax=Pseudonocardia hispaniensis TaxID=904933 RepID=A0ABW1J3A5_9PSEU
MSITGPLPTAAQLSAFRAVAEFLHFRSAAAELGISQSTLSAALAGCEKALGGRLVDRTTRNVALTDRGERLLPSALRALAAIEDLVEQARPDRQPFTGRLRVGAIPTVAPYLLPAAMRELRQRYPRLQITIVEERTAQLVEAVTEGHCDVALLATRAPGLVEEALFEEDFVIVVPPDHPLADATELHPSVLRELDVLLLTEGHCLREQTLDICTEAGVKPRMVDQVASLTTMAQLTAAGLGVTVLPESALALERARSGLAIARFARPAPGRRISLVYRRGDERGDEHAAIAAALRRAARVHRLPVQLVRPDPEPGSAR